jgi:hypothetical protein
MSTRKNAIFRTFSPGVAAEARTGRFSQTHPGVRFQGQGIGGRMGYTEADISPVRFRFVFFAIIYYQQHG